MKRLLLLFLLCMSLCGCSWRDAGDLSAVTAGAITRDDNGIYTLTAELAIPTAERATPDSITITGQANNIAHAIDHAGAGRDTQLYWSHARVMFLDTNILQSGISQAVHDLTVSSEVRPSVRLCAVRGTSPKDIFSQKSVSGDPPGFALGDSMDLAIKQCQTPDLALYRVLDRMESDGIDPIIPAVSVKDNLAVLDGSALFHDDKLCGWLDDAQTSTLCILMQSGDSAAIYDNETRYKLTNIQTKILKNPCRIVLNADIACETTKQAKQAANVLHKQCIDVLKLLQNVNCDALGIQRITGQNWRQHPIDVQVTLRTTQSTEGGTR